MPERPPEIEDADPLGGDTPEEREARIQKEKVQASVGRVINNLFDYREPENK